MFLLNIGSQNPLVVHIDTLSGSHDSNLILSKVKTFLNYLFLKKNQMEHHFDNLQMINLSDAVRLYCFYFIILFYNIDICCLGTPARGK